jgi:hypothetical protein
MSAKPYSDEEIETRRRWAAQEEWSSDDPIHGPRVRWLDTVDALRSKLALATRTAEARGVEITECHAELAAANAEREKLAALLPSCAMLLEQAADALQLERGETTHGIEKLRACAIEARSVLATPPPAPVARETKLCPLGCGNKIHSYVCTPSAPPIPHPPPKGPTMIPQELVDLIRRYVMAYEHDVAIKEAQLRMAMDRVAHLKEQDERNTVAAEKMADGLKMDGRVSVDHPQKQAPPAPPIPEKLGPEGT